MKLHIAMKFGDLRYVRFDSGYSTAFKHMPRALDIMRIALVKSLGYSAYVDCVLQLHPTNPQKKMLEVATEDLVQLEPMHAIINNFSAAYALFKQRETLFSKQMPSTQSEVLHYHFAANLASVHALQSDSNSHSFCEGFFDTADSTRI